MSVFLHRLGLLSAGSPDPVTALELAIFTILGAPQEATSARILEIFTIHGAPQEAASARSVELYTIVEI